MQWDWVRNSGRLQENPLYNALLGLYFHDYFWTKNSVSKCGVLHILVCLWRHRGDPTDDSRAPIKQRFSGSTWEWNLSPVMHNQAKFLLHSFILKLMFPEENSWKGTSVFFFLYFFFFSVVVRRTYLTAVVKITS